MTDSVKKNIKDILIGLPECSGIYQFINKSNDIIYVGKSKNLKKRVGSYFAKAQIGKTLALVNRVCDIKIIITNSEQDALLLENSLIKKIKPAYNILLKDDKTYPWICISNEAFPRVFSTRSRINDGNLYFGPYTSVKMVNTLLDLIQELFKLRDCNLNLSKSNIQSSKFKVCLEYHIGNCKGPCVGDENEDDYLLKIGQIKHILKGNLSKVFTYLSNKMDAFSSVLDFESAQNIKDSINILSEYKSKSTVVSSNITNIDVFGIFQTNERYFLNYFKIINGSIIQSHNAELKIKLNESKENILLHYIILLRQEFLSNSNEILVPFYISYKLDNIKITVPKIGPKRDLIDLSFRNAKFYGLGKLKNEVKYSSGSSSMLELKKKLHLKNEPLHIECFDNSNIQGEFAVSACVVFKNGKPSKKDYRHFKIKTVEGPNDFASMEEVIERRYLRLLKEKQSLPDLIVIDGGKGQLSSSVLALSKIGLDDKIPIIGIAKRLEEIFFPNDSFPMYIDKNSGALKLLQYCRNEAHRFSLKFHRNLRSKSMIKTELDEISGIGSKTKNLLLKNYKSIDKIKRIPEDELSSLIGLYRAKIIFDYFSK